MYTREYRKFAPHLTAARWGIVAATAMISIAMAAGPAAAQAPEADPLRGAVIAFNASMCPPGWEAYAPAQGRFVRGINQNGDRSVDPDGVRAPGHVQADDLKAHTHSYIEMIGDNNVDGVDSTTIRSGDHHNEQRATGYTGGAESRPKNVALLYCERR